LQLGEQEVAVWVFLEGDHWQLQEEKVPEHAAYVAYVLGRGEAVLELLFVFYAAVSGLRNFFT
jgi:hypothetical protein